LMKTSPPMRSDNARDLSSGVRTATSANRCLASSMSARLTNSAVLTTSSCHGGDSGTDNFDAIPL
jgi:hypothetical protein